MVYWGILEYIGVYWGILGYIGVYWSILGIIGYIGLYWDILGILGYFGVYWVYWGILGYIGVYWVYWGILRYIGYIFWRNIISNLFTKTPHVNKHKHLAYPPFPYVDYIIYERSLIPYLEFRGCTSRLIVHY